MIGSDAADQAATTSESSATPDGDYWPAYVATMREFCVNQSCTVLHRWAFDCNGRPANLLMQLKIQTSARD